MIKRILTGLKDKFSNKIVKGQHSYGKPTVVRYGGNEKLYIGKYCSIAKNVTVFLTGGHRTEWISTYPFPAFPKWKKSNISNFVKGSGDVHIGNDVWIGYGVVILPNLRIGDGAVIGAFTIVTRDVPPYSIVVGNPGRIIKKRFDEKFIKNLLKIEWWNWPEKKVRDNIGYLCSSNLEKFLRNNIK